MATQTTNYNLNKPTVGGDTDTWGDLLNTSLDTIDTQMKANADAVAGLGDPVTVAHGGTGATTESDARSALGLGTAATQSDSKYPHRANNLADLNDKAAARANLDVPQVVETTFTLPGVTSAPLFRLVRIGRVVHMFPGDGTLLDWGGTGSGFTASGIIPSGYRPPAFQSYIMHVRRDTSGTAVIRVAVDTDGTLTFQALSGDTFGFGTKTNFFPSMVVWGIA